MGTASEYPRPLSMLRILDRLVQARLIVFDKDGTLITFDRLWHGWFRLVLRLVQNQVPLGDAALAGLGGTLGFDPQTDVWDAAGPLTIASVNEVGLLMAGQLYHHCALQWPRAQAVVSEAIRLASDRLPIEELIEPVGDVRGQLQRLRRGGLLIAVATTDNRAQTERGLAHVGISDLIDALVCGDDGVPVKPDAAMALDVCRRLGVSPREAIMVGDTVGDVEMAHRAGYALAVGVTSGASSYQVLAGHADMVIPDLHAIEIVCETKGK